MKRIFFVFLTLCICCFVSAQSKKIETFDKNTWHWTENADKFHSAIIEDGYLVISHSKFNKKATPYQRLAKSFVKLPLRPSENFKLTVKYLVADYNLSWYSIYFNVDKDCMKDEGETGLFEKYQLFFAGSTWALNVCPENRQVTEYATKESLKTIEFATRFGCFSANGATNFCIGKLPLKVETRGEYPMELVLLKRGKIVTIEVNDMQIFEGELKITKPYFGFQTPMFGKKVSYIKIDEVIVEQVDTDDD